MRGSKQAVGVFALLVSSPAWASDMCELGALVFLPPVFLCAVVAFFVGLVVRGRTATLVWKWLLGLCAIPVFGLAAISMGGAYHGSELRHVGMFNASAWALGVLLAAYVWCFWRLLSAKVEQRPGIEAAPGS
jgi:Na+/H+ antiporter NhaC